MAEVRPQVEMGIIQKRMFEEGSGGSKAGDSLVQIDAAVYSARFETAPRPAHLSSKWALSDIFMNN